MKQLSLAVQMYALDWNETLPHAQSWCDRIAVYLMTKEADRSLQCPSAPSQYGYAYNRALDRQALNEMEAPAETVLLFESDVSRRNATEDASVLAQRHTGGSNLLFAIGYAKFVNQYVGVRLRWSP